MFDIFTPYFDSNCFIDNQKASAKITKIKTNLKPLKISLISLLGKDINQSPINKSRQLYDRVMRSLKPNQSYKFKFLNDYTKVFDHSNNVRKYGFKKVNSFSSPQNRSLLLSTPKKNISKEDSKNDIIYNYNDNKNTSTEMTNNSNNNIERNYIKHNLRILPYKHSDSREKKEELKKYRKIQIKKLVNSLLNRKNNDYYNKFFSNFNKEEKEEKIPKENLIDHHHYFKYNLLKQPFDKSFYIGVKKLIKEKVNIFTKESDFNLLLRRVRDIDNKKINVEKMEIPNSDDNIYKEKYEDLIKQTKRCESFHFKNFNKNKFGFNKIRQYSPYKHIVDRAYKLYLNKNFSFEKYNSDKSNNKSAFIKKFEKDPSKYLSFDTRLNNIIKLSKFTEKKVNRKSREHKAMINNINNIFNSF